MEKKISFALGLIGVFLLGGYATVELYQIKDVEPYRWAITSIVTIGFLTYGNLKNQKNGKEM